MTMVKVYTVLRIPIKLNLYCYYIMYYRSHYIISYLQKIKLYDTVELHN